MAPHHSLLGVYLKGRTSQIRSQVETNFEEPPVKSQFLACRGKRFVLVPAGRAGVALKLPSLPYDGVVYGSPLTGRVEMICPVGVPSLFSRGAASPLIFTPHKNLLNSTKFLLNNLF